MAANIFPDLYQFSIDIKPMNFTIHQYLLLSDAPILISTGPAGYSAGLLPEITRLLGGREPAYILVSHMESDECGGLSVFLNKYPDVITVCSHLCARELPGFGYEGKILPRRQGDVLEESGFSFRFIDYPSEVHLQNGLAFYEETRGIFFSGDLMLRFGDAAGKTTEASWAEEVETINTERVPSAEKLAALKDSLLALDPAFIAVGHGYCVRCSQPDR